ncbi:dihydrofolate reductase [Bacillus ectoiniformans]|uniref:dihydrofolate reductase n=1 Tax=Bacillus ectoiniformans TaxID=1494429 RepID=UPI00195BDB2E|nr:dihydrofolate reductase [Bacillus ectoiniformans]MBM7647913.1 dihydrofolate reductase [Bacillus ectoiniformans]
MISFIWAMDKNGLIGKDNQLPWKLPEDLKFFKETTMGSPIVMGRKTFESIGRPLPGRENIILTRDYSYEAQGCTVVHSLDELWKKAADSDEFFITGGSEIFKKTLPFAERLYVTVIDEAFVGDTYFPPLDWNQWTLISEKKGLKNEKNPYDYYFRIYEKK